MTLAARSQRDGNVLRFPLASSSVGGRTRARARQAQAALPASPKESAATQVQVQAAITALLNSFAATGRAVATSLRIQGVEARLAAVQDEVRWYRYLSCLEAWGHSVEQAAKVRAIWGRAEREIGLGVAPFPMMVRGEADVQVVWSRDAWHLDVDVDPSGAVEWFYRNRTTGETAGTTEEREEQLPDEFFRLLRRHSP